ncbi:hypothetical protein [Streptomyces sp. V1I1]|uniref:hypothetical protein n=1 Tax=Streptomyces sp. V1I1 TaxID=3042272 RepID=UPI00278512E7|nr:hypothetical protein [Streptomyces sp. V1I1]MDQ0938487.1 hypothetical protein [Streptomyces sp. V1I1]
MCKPCRTELTELGGSTGAATSAMVQSARSGDWTEHLAQLARQPLSEDMAS